MNLKTIIEKQAFKSKRIEIAKNVISDLAIYIAKTSNDEEEYYRLLRKLKIISIIIRDLATS